MIVFQQLHYFTVVAECGSMNQAAQRLFISQQSLRSSMNSLEERLGFPLFHRSSKGVQLTEAGLAILKDARQILATAAGWEQFASPQLSGPATVHVVASPLVYNTVLTDLILDCRSKHPNLRIQSYNAREDELLGKLGEHKIGVIGSAPNEVVRQKLHPFAASHHLEFETFGLDQFCVYLSCSNPLAKQPYLTLDQLNTLTLTAYPEEDQRFHYRAIHQYFSSSPPYFVEKLENMFQLIAETPEIAAVFPHLAVANNIYVQRGQITALTVRDFPMPAISCMFFPEAERITPAEKIVASAIRQRLRLLAHQLA